MDQEELRAKGREVMAKLWGERAGTPSSARWSAPPA